MKAIGQSTWAGTWKEGTGTISTSDGTLNEVPYSYASRFDGAPGASPEELFGAAHAGCFNQALANNFGMIGFKADWIRTSIEIEVGTGEDGHPAITGSHITVTAAAPNVSQEQFDYCAERARVHCTIAKILKIDPTMVATLVPSA